MTRETKIGLLVGLAFIIVIGILLSDHLTNSTEPPPATLAMTGNNVRQTVNTPGAIQAQPATVITPEHVEPQRQVPTPRELQPQTPPTSIVRVGGPSTVMEGQRTPVDMSAQNESQPPITMVTNDPTPARPPEQAVAPRSAENRPASAEDDLNAANNALKELALQRGEPLVNLTGNGKSTAPAASNGTSGTDYVAQAGDSVSRIAGKMMGGNTKANRDALINANASLQADPNKVIVGKTYKIPGAVAAAPNPSSNSQPSVSLASQTMPPTAATREPTAATEYWYTVKEGDSLWRIANEQLGKGGTGVASIKELNKDVLNGGDTVHPNMRLRLPGKPVVQAN